MRNPGLLFILFNVTHPCPTSSSSTHSLYPIEPRTEPLTVPLASVQTLRKDAAASTGDHLPARRCTCSAVCLYYCQRLDDRAIWHFGPMAELLCKQWPILCSCISWWMDPGGAGPHDPVHHLQLHSPLPVLLPALHSAEGRALLPHRSFPDLGQSVCDERRHHLHCDESWVGAHFRLLRVLLYPGLGGLPPGSHQRTHLCHLKEARMSPISFTTSPIHYATWPRALVHALTPLADWTVTSQAGVYQNHHGNHLQNPTTKDVNSIYGLKPIYNTFYIYVHSFVLLWYWCMSFVLAD